MPPGPDQLPDGLGPPGRLGDRRAVGRAEERAVGGPERSPAALRLGRPRGPARGSVDEPVPLHGLVGEGDADALAGGEHGTVQGVERDAVEVAFHALRPSRTSMPQTVPQGLSCRLKAISPMPSTTVSLIAHTDSRTGAAAPGGARRPVCRMRSAHPRAPGRPCRRPRPPPRHRGRARSRAGPAPPPGRDRAPARASTDGPGGRDTARAARPPRAGPGQHPAGRRPVNRADGERGAGHSAQGAQEDQDEGRHGPVGAGAVLACAGVTGDRRPPQAVVFHRQPQDRPRQDDRSRRRQHPGSAQPADLHHVAPPSFRSAAPPAPSPHDRAAGEHDAPRSIRSAVSSQRTHRPARQPSHPSPVPAEGRVPRVKQMRCGRVTPAPHAQEHDLE